jgi:hypothetical protein
VLGFKLPFYSSPTLLLSPALSLRVLFSLWSLRPDVIHVSTPGLMVFAATLYAKMLQIPLVMSYHTHIPGAALGPRGIEPQHAQEHGPTSRSRGPRASLGAHVWTEARAHGGGGNA